METDLVYKKTWLALGAAFVLLVIYLSLTTHPIDAPTIDGFKSGHVLAYGWLMFWYLQIYRSRGRVLSIALGLCLMGVTLEFLQGMTNYRHFGYSDMRDNAIGVVIGLLLGLTPMRNLLARVETLQRSIQ